MKESRREFLKRTGGGLAALTMASQLQQLGMMNAMATPVGTSYEGYKALVLVFLAGGNDGNNMVVPNHSNSSFSTWQDYKDQRGDLTLSQAALDLNPIFPVSQGGAKYGLHPSLGQLHELFTGNKMAIVTNVGTLVQPMTRAEYLGDLKPKPLQLFSHADQIEQNQTAISNASVDHKGWGGRISDKINSMANPDAVIPMITSIAGAQIFSIGDAVPLSVGDSGMQISELFKFSHTRMDDTIVADTFEDLARIRPRQDPPRMISKANEITTQALNASAALHDVETHTPFPATGIGRQLEQVARMIKLSTAESTLNINRQIFFCQLGGFDTHAYQLTQQAGLLAQFAAAVRAFYDEMGELKVSDRVTTFTMSDFARTLRPNGVGPAAGSDHAWGNHHFVIGDAVNGGNFYGVPNPIDQAPFPRLDVGSNCDMGDRGRWIPTTSTTEYGAALTRWFAEGVQPDTLQEIFPHFDTFNNIPGRCKHMEILVPCG